MNFPVLAYCYLTEVWKWLASSPLALLRVLWIVKSWTLHGSHPYLASLQAVPGHPFGLLETKQKQNPPAHRPSRKSGKAVRFLGSAPGKSLWFLGGWPKAGLLLSVCSMGLQLRLCHWGRLMHPGTWCPPEPGQYKPPTPNGLSSPLRNGPTACSTAAVPFASPRA